MRWRWIVIIEVKFAHTIESWLWYFESCSRASFLYGAIVCGLLFVLIAWHSVDCGRQAGGFIAGVLVGHGFRS